MAARYAPIHDMATDLLEGLRTRPRPQSVGEAHMLALLADAASRIRGCFCLETEILKRGMEARPQDPPDAAMARVFIRRDQRRRTAFEAGQVWGPARERGIALHPRYGPAGGKPQISGRPHGRRARQATNPALPLYNRTCSPGPPSAVPACLVPTKTSRYLGLRPLAQKIQW